ncbi:MAG: recombinase family protein [Oscillospiraceae bacterium]|jgi:DNA invertase Pin-like site-specific DNA recombinase|nr:recombinase family protein [Oscillospiraceae bacterium]
MDNRIDALYGRQSVDKKDSISIESQLEFCQYETHGGAYKTYTDKGFSGKNTDRPKFQELLRDINKGLVKRVIVYKLDRISRSILDFANMMELFSSCGVEFVSCTEKFDTSTPMGRAMLSICIIFAQLERETIRMRVIDTYYSRCVKGFKMGGAAPYGFRTEPMLLDGIKTKKLVPKDSEPEIVTLMYDMFEKPASTLGDLTRHLAERGVQLSKGEITRQTVNQLLRNPVYVQADLDVYEYFKSFGVLIENPVEDFTGIHGCYLYLGRDAKQSKRKSLAGCHLVLAPHEGIIPSDVWLRCNRKLTTSKASKPCSKAQNTWLAGKIKCAKCGHALVHTERNGGKYAYLRCRLRSENKSCAGCGTIHEAELERLVFEQMSEHMREFQTLSGGHSRKADPKLTELKVRLAKVEDEIDKLVDTLSGANPTLLSYANRKIEELDASRQSLMQQVAELTCEELSPKSVKQISDYLAVWNEVSFDDKRQVLGAMVSRIRASSENVEIEWRI